MQNAGLERCQKVYLQQSAVTAFLLIVSSLFARDSEIVGKNRFPLIVYFNNAARQEKVSIIK